MSRYWVPLTLKKSVSFSHYTVKKCIFTFFVRFAIFADLVINRNYYWPYKFYFMRKCTGRL